jgi:hypothetical protein
MSQKITLRLFGRKRRSDGRCAGAERDFLPGKDPGPNNRAISQVIVPRTVDLGDFAVRRALPSARTHGRAVHPSIISVGEFRAGNGLDVRPHPYRARYRHLSIRRRNHAATTSARRWRSVLAK